MFVRLKPPPIISQFRLRNFRISHRIQFVRHCSDIKTNEELLFTNIASKTNSSPLRIKSALKAGYYDYTDGYTCIQTECAACVPAVVGRGNTNLSSDSKKCIYINKTTGDVICSKCQYIFSYNAIEQFYNNKEKLADIQRNREMFMSSKPAPASLPATKIDKDAVPINEMNTNELQTILSDLGLEQLIEILLQETGIYCNISSKVLYFPMMDAASNICGYKILSRRAANGGIIESTVPETNSFGVVILPPVVKKGPKDQKTAILVLNMLDALALRREKQNVTIICLPHGFKMLPQECLPVLEPYQKLILWFEYDSAGWDMAKNFAKKLDEKRCHFIRPTESSPTPYLAMQRSIPLKTILSHAQPIAHKAVTTFRTLRQDVLSDLHNIDKVQGVQWSRFPTLNKYLQGHRRGELTVLTGPTGCGKTTFMAEYSLDLAIQGVNTLWGSFEIRNTLLARTLLQQLARKPLDENLEEFDKWADKFEELPMYFMTFYGQQPLKVVMEAVEHSQYVHDIQHVIIDNLQFMMGTSQDPRQFDKYWKQDEIISSFRTFATRQNCHVTLVIHPRKERADEDLTINSIFGSAKATQEADNVLIIQDKRLISVKGKKYLQVAKNRHSGELGIMMLEFDKDAKSYSQDGKSSIKHKKSKT